MPPIVPTHSTIPLSNKGYSHSSRHHSNQSASTPVFFTLFCTFVLFFELLAINPLFSEVILNDAVISVFIAPAIFIGISILFIIISDYVSLPSVYFRLSPKLTRI